MTNVIGMGLNRVDGRAKVTGVAKYAGDFQIPDLTFAVAVESSIAKGKIVSIDLSEASVAPGVLEIFTHENMPRLAVDEKGLGHTGQSFTPLMSDSIRYAGQFVAVVLADSIAAASHAAGLVKIVYAEEKATLWTGEAAETEKPSDEEAKAKVDSSRGDPDAALKDAPVVVRPSYWICQENHNPMEMSATTAAWTGDRLTVYTSTQNVIGARNVIAKAVGLPPASVRVIDPYVGGGFGCKGSVWPHEYLTPLLAKALKRPVKWVLTRSQMFTAVGSRPYTRQNLELAATANGKLTAITHHVFNHTSVMDHWTESCARQTRFLYKCPNVRTSHRIMPMDSSTPCQMRAPGHAGGTWALEMAMDELAYAVEIDPLELRLRNDADADDDVKKPFSSKSLRQCYEQAAERFGWAKRNHKPGSMRDGRTLIGWGMASATYPAEGGSASVRVRLMSDGTAMISTASHDLGTGTYTILAQIAAETLGWPVDRVRVELGNSTLPTAPGSGGSRTAATVGSAVKTVCDKARKSLFEAMASDPSSVLHGLKTDDFRSSNGRVSSGEIAEEIALFLKKRGSPIDVTGEGGMSPEAKNFSTHSFGAHFVDLRIDPDVRTIRVSRIVSAFGAGRILNEKTAHSQIMGAIVMGMGAALLEGTVYDPRYVRIANSNLADYSVPVNADVPKIDCFFVEEKDPHLNDLGIKGVGELGITGIAAAIVNAAFHATGKRIRELPMTLDLLL